MSSTAIGLRETRAARFWDSTNGKKAVMAVSGVILFAFVLLHMLGNLQVFEGPEKFNGYAKLLRVAPEALWAARITLLAMVVLHIVASVQLALRKKRARPVSYQKRESIASSYASRTMYWSGPVVLAFVIYHLLDLTFGTLNPDYIEGDVYHNTVASFSHPAVAIGYIVAVTLLGFHLRHGVWSMLQTLGISHPRYTPWFKRLATVFAVIVTVGFISIPIGVMLGVVR